MGLFDVFKEKAAELLSGAGDKVSEVTGVELPDAEAVTDQVSQSVDGVAESAQGVGDVATDAASGVVDSASEVVEKYQP
jgi:hypothetical protein